MFLQLSVCVFTMQFSLFSVISTCDGLLSHGALHPIPLDHGAALTPAGEVLRQEKLHSPSHPLALPKGQVHSVIQGTVGRLSS